MRISSVVFIAGAKVTNFGDITFYPHEILQNHIKDMNVNRQNINKR